MSFLLKFFSICCLFTSLSALAQNYQFKLEGSFNTTNTPDPSVPVAVNYSLSWNETSTSIQGLYQDNYYVQSPHQVTGTVETEGRTFNVILPEVTNNVKAIVIKTPQTGTANASVSIDLKTQDSLASTIDNINSFALMSSTTSGTPSRPNNSCVIGFGALSGFCGLYSGTITETSDATNRCNLLSGGQPRLELATDTQFNLYLNYTDSIQNLPKHSLGTYVFSPDGSIVTLRKRHCGALPGTTFLATNCQILNLNINYSQLGSTKSFNGTYVISDEKTLESCSYKFNVNQEVAY